MKQKILVLIILLTSVVGFSQTIQTQGSPNRATRYLGGLQADSTFVVPVQNRDSIYPNLPYKGRLHVNSETNALEYHNGDSWINIDTPTLEHVLLKDAEAEIDTVFGVEASEIYLNSDNDINIVTPPEAAFNHNGNKVLTEGLLGVGNGIATLDSEGKISSGELPSSVMTLEGEWNASTNIPSLSDGIGNPGMVYKVTVPGIRNLGNGSITFAVGDYAVYGNDGKWHKSINSNEVTSVNGYKGAVDLEISDIPNLQETINNISVLQAIDEGNGIGYTTANRNAANYGNIGLRAVDLSYSSAASTTKGARGADSFAAGQNSAANGAGSFALDGGTANGTSSFSIGTGTTASGSYSFAVGFNVDAAKEYTFAIGNGSYASGAYSAAIGRNNTSHGYGEVSIGYFANQPLSSGRNSPVAGDPIFTVGNGISGTSRSNAYILLNNGVSTQYGIASYGADYTPSMINDRNIPDIGKVKQIIAPISVFQAIDEGSGMGYILSGRDTANYGNIGNRSVDFSYSVSSSSSRGATGSNSFAVGTSVTASGQASVVLGSSNTASGARSFAAGFGNTATGNDAVVFGNNSHATGIGSFAVGIQAAAQGTCSAAIGYNLDSRAYASLSIGQFNNSIISNQTSWTSGSPLFLVGNGENSANRSNAYVLFNNGTSTQYGMASYGSDYSAGYTDRSIPDVEWVEGKLSKLCITDLSFISTKSATELNAAYPDATNGFEVIAPNVGSGMIYKKTNQSGQWIAITGTTLNP